MYSFYFISCIVVASAGMPILNVNTIGNLTLNERQIVVLKLLNHMMQPRVHEDLDKIGRTYSLEENIHMYTKAEVVKGLVTKMKTGFLPPGELFCLHCESHMREAIDMFHTLYCAKDFKTFVQTACWMRLRMNENMLIYALTVAIRHSENTRELIVPSPFEIYPYFFVHSDVIKLAYSIKMKQGLPAEHLCQLYGIQSLESHTYAIDENIHDQRGDLNIESRLRYFTEDIGLNTYYYNFHVDFPFWMNTYKTKSRHGELTYYVHQQLLARYNLERLSHNMCDVEPLSFYQPLKAGFWPNLQFHNGMDMPMRYNNYVIPHDDNCDVIGLIDNFEKLIKDAITKGFINMLDGTTYLKKQKYLEVLARLIYGSPNILNERVHQNLPIMMKSLFSFGGCQKYFVLPTALDQYQTSLRDPVFWKLHKRIVEYFRLFKMRLPSYSSNQLQFAGVRVESIVFDKMVTYFDDFLMDMTNAVILSNEEIKKRKSDMTLLVRKRRLNHQAFTVNIDVVSDKTIGSVIRIFLGPKTDCMGRTLNIEENYHNFIEIDTFIHGLENGINRITRKSSDMNNLARDRLMTRYWKSNLETLSKFEEMMTFDMKNFHTGFPMRLLLPMGRVGGMAAMVLVVVSPLKLNDAKDKLILNNVSHTMERRFSVMLDKMPLGYPLDRPIDSKIFPTANMKFSEVIIFHKNTECHMKLRWEQHVLKGYNLNQNMNR